jgi:hypothetical protein
MTKRSTGIRRENMLERTKASSTLEKDKNSRFFSIFAGPPWTPGSRARAVQQGKKASLILQRLREIN